MKSIEQLITNIIILMILFAPSNAYSSDNIVEEGRASYYYHGKITANGEDFDKNGLTLASRYIPFNTEVKIEVIGVIQKGISKEQKEFLIGRSVTCRVNDRGPYGAITKDYGRVWRMHYVPKDKIWKVKVKNGNKSEWIYTNKKPGKYRGLVDLSLGCARELTQMDKPPVLKVRISYQR